MVQRGGSVSPMDPLSSTVSNPVATPSALVTWPGARVLMVLLGAEYSFGEGVDLHFDLPASWLPPPPAEPSFR